MSAVPGHLVAARSRQRVARHSSSTSPELWFIDAASQQRRIPILQARSWRASLTVYLSANKVWMHRARLERGSITRSSRCGRSTPLLLRLRSPSSSGSGLPSSSGSGAPKTAGPSHPPPPPVEKLPPPSPDGEELREKAEASRDALINTIMDPKAKKKAGILADAALTGVMVTKIEVLATAENGDLACNFVLQSSGIDARLAVCEAAMATSVSRRLLSVPNFVFDIDLITSVASVTREDIETAIVKLISSGLSPTMSELDPVAELKSLPGVDDAAVSQFAKDAYDLNLVSGTDGSDGSAEVNININEGGGNGDDPDVLITTVVSVGVAALVCFGGMCACYARHRTNARFLMDLDIVKELLPNSMQDKLLTGGVRLPGESLSEANR